MVAWAESAGGRVGGTVWKNVIWRVVCIILYVLCCVRGGCVLCCVCGLRFVLHYALCGVFCIGFSALCSYTRFPTFALVLSFGITSVKIVRQNCSWRGTDRGGLVDAFSWCDKGGVEAELKLTGDGSEVGSSPDITM
ncbi:hypothetical protein B0J18DRAFT_422607 [Chaetomium sp. MPI-SDFR-AT-0129]|nr:hypothetical protein B0J18DRAFT_422607 [Chaetomium sp. MPI-SDFR-AT-0129]